jgi:hypothetical protein
MKSFCLIVIIAFTVLSFAAAQEPTAGREHGHRSPEKMMDKLDTNHDGKISLEEWKNSPRGQRNPSRAEEKFNKLDTNHDGSITLDELKMRQSESGHERGGRAKHNPSASPSPSVSP